MEEPVARIQTDITFFGMLAVADLIQLASANVAFDPSSGSNKIKKMGYESISYNQTVRSNRTLQIRPTCTVPNVFGNGHHVRISSYEPPPQLPAVQFRPPRIYAPTEESYPHLVISHCIVVLYLVQGTSVAFHSQRQLSDGRTYFCMCLTNVFIPPDV